MENTSQSALFSKTSSGKGPSEEKTEGDSFGKSQGIAEKIEN